MELDPNLFVKPVDGHDDLYAFQYSFGVAPEGKATEPTFTLDSDAVVELDDGDLLIEGWAANFEGLDRQGENFVDGAFKRGIKSFLDAGGPLCFHHKNDHGIGKVVALDEVEGKGLRMKARVDKQESSSPLHYIYNAIKKGSYNGLSVGGFFKRKLTEAGYRIADMDFTEISVTPVPVHPGTSFAVVAGKALESDEETTDGNVETPDETLVGLQAAVDSLTGFVEAWEGEGGSTKALPNTQNIEAAYGIRDILEAAGKLRERATNLRRTGEWAKERGQAGFTEEDTSGEEALGNLADKIETSLSSFEAEAHELAAKYGPIPTPAPRYVD